MTDLARAKSEALDNIYSCVKQNINGEKTTIGLISKKATLHVQHTILSGADFVYFFAVVLHNNVKLPETSWLHVLWRNCRMCSVHFFFFFSLPLIFTFVAASFSCFPTAATKFHVVLPKKMSSLSFR